MEQVNYGYDPRQEEQDREVRDYPLFSGKFEKVKYCQPLKDFRPEGEKQANRWVDSFMCVLFSLCKCIAYRMNWRMRTGVMTIQERAWLEGKKLIKDGKFNASDLFLGIMAHVVQYRGTSMKNGIETAKEVGLIAELLFPFRTEAKNWSELTAEPSEETKATAKEFLERYKLWYEDVGMNIRAMRAALDYGPLWVAGAAWYNQVNGVYQRVESTANHCFVVDTYIDVDGVKNDYWEAPDSYPTTDSNFIKKLAWNYKFWYVKQVDVEYLLEEQDIAETNQLLSEKDKPLYVAPADGHVNGYHFIKGVLLSFKQMWEAIFYGVKKIGGEVIEKLRF